MDWLARLRATGRTLPDEQRREILALGSDAIPGLIEVLAAESLLDAKDGDQDSPPTHAAALLTELRAIEAIGPMIRVHARYSSAALSEHLHKTYAVFGGSVVQPAGHRARHRQ